MRESFIFRHFNKIFTGIFVSVIIIFLAQVAIGTWLAVEVKDKGLKTVIACVWEGSDSEECK